jgi:hypothetical protein
MLLRDREKRGGKNTRKIFVGIEENEDERTIAGGVLPEPLVRKINRLSSPFCESALSVAGESDEER